ncbi:MAG TPA: VOC family protein [Opitutaceae bacterium]|jgi:catechol 2,3-dioxygenase-like lactoylglutathione lyase family enzyme
MSSSQKLFCVTYLVRDYDEAIVYFTHVLRFHLIEDTRLSPVKRWVVVSPPGDGTVRLLLAQAANDHQKAHITEHAGGRVAYFLRTDQFDEDYAAMKARGVNFLEAPRDESYGRVAVFADLYGNRWDFIGPRPR